MRSRSLALAAATIGLLAAGLAPARAEDPQPEITDVVIVNPNDGHEIHATVFKPAAATETDVPVVLHSHGWGGSRSRAGFSDWLDAGYGVLSFDQRGFGESTDDKAYIQDPAKEGLDVVAVIDHVAALDWVAHDLVPVRTGEGEGRGAVSWQEDASDPALFAIGGSYGGGYQFAGAFLDEVLRREHGGHTRFNALAPEITWYDLNDSLGPQGVPRTVWDTLLAAAGATALPEEVLAAYAWGSATGRYPDGSLGGPDVYEFMRDNAPRYWVEERGIQLDIPVLLGQGATDNLFNLNQGISNFQRSLTDGARQRSMLVGYNGGHALPSVVPAGIGPGGDPCSELAGGFGELTRSFFAAVASGAPTRPEGFAAYNIATTTNTCIRTDSVDPATSVPVAAPLGPIVTTTGVGVPQHLPIATGPIRLAGVPRVSAELTTVGVDARAFLALSVGTSPQDAQIIQNNVLPINRPLPVDAERVSIELPGVGVEVPAGQTLFLTVSPLSDMFIGMNSRVPGVVLLDDVEVQLPTQP